jgi:hypothetical protein
MIPWYLPPMYVNNCQEGLFAFTLWTKSNSWESCQVAFHNWNSQWSQVSVLYQNIKALYMSSIGTFFMWNQISARFIFTWPENMYYPFLSALYLDLMSYLMESTGTGQVNATCPVGSTLGWSAEFKHINISANSVHSWGDWQHLKGHWKRERQSLTIVWT